MERFRWARAAALLLVLGPAAPSAAAQTGRVAVDEENFRSEPGGSILAELYQGTPLTLGGRQDRWREATLEAWIWGRSVQEQRAGELDVVVNAEGENLRASPNGERLGRAQGGMRLDVVETRGDWLRVRRTGWIWIPSIEVQEAAEAPVGEEAPERAAAGSPGRAAATPAATGDRDFAAAPRGTLLLDGPAGDTLARLQRDAAVEVVARDGDWTRVRIEGWTFTGALGGGESATGAVLRGLSRDSLQARPELFRGRMLEWELQFIALREAERFRTDFLEGELFILARGPGDDPGFVYVAVPSDVAAEVRRLNPLQTVRLLTRVRSVRSPLTGAPVLELLEITER